MLLWVVLLWLEECKVLPHVDFTSFGCISESGLPGLYSGWIPGVWAFSILISIVHSPQSFQQRSRAPCSPHSCQQMLLVEIPDFHAFWGFCFWQTFLVAAQYLAFLLAVTEFVLEWRRLKCMKIVLTKWSRLWTGCRAEIELDLGPCHHITLSVRRLLEGQDASCKWRRGASSVQAMPVLQKSLPSACVTRVLPRSKLKA